MRNNFQVRWERFSFSWRTKASCCPAPQHKLSPHHGFIQAAKTNFSSSPQFGFHRPCQPYSRRCTKFSGKSPFWAPVPTANHSLSLYPVSQPASCNQSKQNNQPLHLSLINTLHTIITHQLSRQPARGSDDPPSLWISLIHPISPKPLENWDQWWCHPSWTSTSFCSALTSQLVALSASRTGNLQIILDSEVVVVRGAVFNLNSNDCHFLLWFDTSHEGAVAVSCLGIIDWTNPSV